MCMVACFDLACRQGVPGEHVVAPLESAVHADAKSADLKGSHGVSDTRDLIGEAFAAALLEGGLRQSYLAVHTDYLVVSSEDCNRWVRPGCEPLPVQMPRIVGPFTTIEASNVPASLLRQVTPFHYLRCCVWSDGQRVVVELVLDTESIGRPWKPHVEGATVTFRRVAKGWELDYLQEWFE